MGLFWRRSSRDVTVIFDIGSSSIGGAVVEYGEDEFPTLLFSTRRAIQFKKEFDFEHFFSSMIRTFETVTAEVLTPLAHVVEDVSTTIKDSKKRAIGRRRIGDIYCVFGSPWYHARVVSFNETFDAPTLVTEDAILSIAKKAADDLRSSYEDPESVRLLENRILDYTLNGYRVEHQKPMHARTVGVNTYTSSISKDTVAAVKKPIRNTLATRPVRGFSGLMAFFSVMREMQPHKGSFMTADIRGEVTEIGVVHEDALVHTTTFPFGRHTIVRDMAGALGIELFDAHSRLALYLNDKADEGEQERLGSILEKEKSMFCELFQSAVEEIENIPRTLFLLSDKETEAWFQDALEAVLTAGGSGREVEVLDEDFLSRYSDVSKLRYGDHFLTFEALFIRLVRKGEI